ncbi:hypothetical protein [Actinokineospora spheciospongiae]|uniref:hypothetical protein n=1 Tax=Actinokineospora spheciospongiae TaxID=909613 RepID=UPI0026C779E7|nr:hypothetical protein [Actinokineospora spheciospongiae]
MTEKVVAEKKAKAGLFDLRGILALLFGVYGVVLTVMGLVSTSQADLDKAAGVNINLWMGVFMLVVALAFLAWARLRPLAVPETTGETATGSTAGSTAATEGGRGN